LTEGGNFSPGEAMEFLFEYRVYWYTSE